jgi:hypothetical protein
LINSHIIPAFYLEQFATPSLRGENKPGRIWVYEKGAEPDERGTSVQGREKGYFGFVRPDGSLEESLESDLADRENECGDVLVSAKSVLFDWTSTASRNKLAFYAGLLFSRATQRRTFTAENWVNLQKRFVELVNDDSYVNDLAVHYRKRYQEATPVRVRERLLKLAEDIKSKAYAKNVFLSDLYSNAEFIRNILLPRLWSVWRAPEGSEFITSDNPLVTFLPINGEFAPGHGFGVPGVVAAFPLAPSAALIVGVPGRPEPHTVEAAQVMKLNELIVRLCDRYVYSRTRSIDVQRIVDESAGSARYGKAAFTRAGLKMPDIKDFMRRHLGLDAETSMGAP